MFTPANVSHMIPGKPFASTEPYFLVLGTLLGNFLSLKHLFVSFSINRVKKKKVPNVSKLYKSITKKYERYQMFPNCIRVLQKSMKGYLSFH